MRETLIGDGEGRSSRGPNSGRTVSGGSGMCYSRKRLSFNLRNRSSRADLAHLRNRSSRADLARSISATFFGT